MRGDGGVGGWQRGAAGAAFAQHHCWGPYGAAPSLARVWGHPDAPPAPDPRRELTPLEEASLQNQKLKAAYEARVARLNPSQAVQKTSLVSGELGAGAAGSWGRWDPHPGAFFGCHRRSVALQTLSLQRQMMENLVIAKAREETVSLPLGESSEQGPGL